MGRVMGIEPTIPGPQPGALTIWLHPPYNLICE